MSLGFSEDVAVDVDVVADDAGEDSVDTSPSSSS